MVVGIIIAVAVVLIVVVGIVAYFGNQEGDGYIPLLEFETIEISPSAVFGTTTVKEGGAVIITVDVKSLSDDYQNNGKLEVVFEHDDAYQYFQIDENTKNVGTIQQKGATSGPKSFTITAIKDPGGYEDIAMVKLLIDGNLNDETSFKLKIE